MTPEKRLFLLLMILGPLLAALAYHLTFGDGLPGLYGPPVPEYPEPEGIRV